MPDRSRSRSRSRSPSDRAPQDDRHGGRDHYENGHGGDSNNGDEVKLYIGNLDYATNEDRLREEFGHFGKVTDVFLPMERGTNRPRGFGFVTMATRSSAEEAIRRMDQAQLDGRTIRVNESRPRGEGPPPSGGGSGSVILGPGGRGTFNVEGKPEVKLYVGNLAFDTTEDSVRKLFEPYGPIIDCFLPQDRDSAKPRGFAFVTMNAADAEQACMKVNGMEVDGRALRVNEAQPKGSAPPRGGYGGAYDDRGSGGGYGGGSDVTVQETYCGPISMGVGCLLCIFFWPAALCVPCCPCDMRVTTYRNGVPITTH